MADDVIIKFGADVSELQNGLTQVSSLQENFATSSQVAATSSESQAQKLHELSVGAYGLPSQSKEWANPAQPPVSTTASQAGGGQPVTLNYTPSISAIIDGVRLFVRRREMFWGGIPAGFFSPSCCVH